MAKNNTPSTEAIAARSEPVAETFPLTISEFCSRLSAVDKRVEMVSAFHASEKAAGRPKDSEHSYRSRYEAFCNAPA